MSRFDAHSQFDFSAGLEGVVFRGSLDNARSPSFRNFEAGIQRLSAELLDA